MRRANISKIHAVLTLALLMTISSTAVSREWVDATGNFRVKGEVISYDGKVVRLALEDGFAVNLPVAKLSGDDQAYLKKTFPNGKTAEKPGKPGASGDGKSGAKAEVVGLAIVKPVAGASGEDAGLFTPGTHVRLLITGGDETFVNIDTEKSKIASFVDNKNTSLLDSDATSGDPLTFEALEDGKSALVTIHTPQIPASKTVRLTLKGDLHLATGLGGAETVRVPLNLELTLGL